MMKPDLANRLIAPAALAIVAAAAPSAADDARIRLSISELAPGATYRGTCRVAGSAPVLIDGTSAHSYDFDTGELRCEIAAAAPLTITIEHAGNRARTRTAGGRVVVDLS
jgi:hypothetical protein